MRYTGVVDFDFLTLMQILAMAEEPTGVEFYDEEANFIGQIYIANGWLTGAIFGDLGGEEAFTSLVGSQITARGTFRKVPYLQAQENISGNVRIDALLLSAVADKETKDGRALGTDDETSASRFPGVSASSVAFSSEKYSAKGLTESRLGIAEKTIAPELFSPQPLHICSVFSLFNVESILLYKELAGHLIVFTERYWRNLFPLVDPDSLDEAGVQAHTCFIMADISRRHLSQKIPNFDATFMSSEELLAQVDIAMEEANEDNEEVKIIKISPGQSYDDEMSLVTGFSDTALHEPSIDRERIYHWLDERLTAESAPLRYLFYPDNNNPIARDRSTIGPYRIVVAAGKEFCNKICLNIRHYLGEDGLLLYSITTPEEFTAVDRSDWEDCHLAILTRGLISTRIFDVLERIPETMAVCLLANSRAKYRDYLTAPMFRERIQTIFTDSDQDLANLIQTISEIASFQLTGSP